MPRYFYKLKNHALNEILKQNMLALCRNQKVINPKTHFKEKPMLSVK